GKNEKGMERRSPGMMRGKYRLAGEGQAGRGRLSRSERRARLHHVGPAGQRIGREAARREAARDRIVVIQRVEQVVDADRPEEVLVRSAQLEIDGPIR